MKWPSPTETALLDLMGTRERTGREIAKAYTKEHGSFISYGTLYSALRRLKEGGWIDMREGEDEDGRLRYYKLTGEGARLLPRLRKMDEAFGVFEAGGVT
jgi:DNA-binding PadR family transcriptional regulator